MIARTNAIPADVAATMRELASLPPDAVSCAVRLLAGCKAPADVRAVLDGLALLISEQAAQVHKPRLAHTMPSPRPLSAVEMNAATEEAREVLRALDRETDGMEKP